MNHNSINNNKKEKWLFFLLALSCGLIVANLYYAQPLVSLISKSIHISSAASGLIVTFTQIGYVIGLLFLVPLSDKKENIHLVSLILLITVAGLFLAAFTKSSLLFFIAVFLIGLGAVAAQVLVPYASHLALPEQRGQLVGNVMSGLLLGIMLARPVSSLVADFFGWQSIFIISAVLILLLIILLRIVLPKRIPESEVGYLDMIQSLWHLFRTIPLLRKRALYQACLFGSFSLFWTVIPMWLMEHYHLTQRGVALFALVGVAGSVAAPIAGRLADRGLGNKLTQVAFILAMAAFLLTRLLPGNTLLSFILVVIAAIILDMAVSGNLVLGQQAIYTLGEDIRGRVNAVFMAVFFLGGALGSAFGSLVYAQGGWASTSILGFTLPLLAFIYFLTDPKNRKTIKANKTEANL